MAVTSSTLALGTPLPTFRLPDTLTGVEVASEDFTGKALVVTFICNHCPYVLHILDALVQFGRDALEQGVPMVAISSNDIATYPADAPPLMKALAEERKFPFPYLFDESQDVARAFGAECTPEFFLFDATLRLVYRGQFDSSRPSKDVAPTGEDLRAALTALVTGQAPASEQRQSIGCSIKWRAK